MISGKDLLGEFEAHRDHLLGYTLALTRDPQAAEEIFQEVGLAVVEEARKGLEVGRFLGWAREVIRRRAAEHFRLRSRLRERERPFDGLIERAFSEFESAGEDPPGRHGALLECLCGLPDRRRELIEARYGERKSIRAIAQALSWTEGSVKVALWKARRTLFKCVEGRTRVLMTKKA